MSVLSTEFNSPFGSFDPEKQFAIAMYGKGAFTQNEWSNIDERQKRFAMSLYKKGQQSLNILKQQKIIEKSNKLLMSLKIFTDSKFNNVVKTIIKEDKPYAGYFCNMSFKDLEITQTEIKSFLMNERIIRV